MVVLASPRCPWDAQRDVALGRLPQRATVQSTTLLLATVLLTVVLLTIVLWTIVLSTTLPRQIEPGPWRLELHRKNGRRRRLSVGLRRTSVRKRNVPTAALTGSPGP